MSSEELVVKFVVKVVVAGEGHDGPNLYSVKVACSQDQYDNGNHYEAAKDYVSQIFLVDRISWACDENDPAKDVLNMFNWDKVNIIKV